MDPDERPQHLVVDCSPPPPPVLDEDGNPVPVDLPSRIAWVPLTDEEWEEFRRVQAADIARIDAERAERETLAAQVAAHPDPLVKLLAARQGLA